MTAAELERSLREKNDLRRPSGLPPCFVARSVHEGSMLEQ